MKTVNTIAIFVMFILCTSSSMGWQVVKPLDEHEKIANEFLQQLLKGDFTAATANFDATMKSAMPASKMEQTWNTLNAQVGAFKEHTSTRKQSLRQYIAVILTCSFEKANLDMRVVIDGNKKIAGLQFQPAQGDFEFAPPPYAKQEAFTEQEITVGQGQWALPGTLTMPKGAGPFPAVVLVHGSGPNDRDETIGPNKPFRDLAWGLASQGIASIRYVKRTRQHGTQFAALMNDLTVKEETIDDALLAVALLRQTPKINKQQIFVIGHSLGAFCVPRIGLRDENIAGFVVMAGNVRPLEDLILEQYTYIFSLAGQLNEEQQKQLKQIQDQVALVKTPDLNKSIPAEKLPLGIPAAYWLDLRDYNSAQVATKVKAPMFIIQGARDYQVTTEDFKLWQEALSSRKNVQFKLYPALNHLFMTGEGKAKPVEYQQAGHMARNVIDDIANWVKKN